MKKRKLLTIVSPNYDDLEFFYPMIRMREEGHEVVIASEVKGDTLKENMV